MVLERPTLLNAQDRFQLPFHITCYRLLVSEILFVPVFLWGSVARALKLTFLGKESIGLL